MEVSTVGYGSVPVISKEERIFAMFAMVVGAVICDAGITAVLTSIISNKDHQAGTNNRRVQCSKRFMMSNFIDKNFQERVLDYYAYTDTELRNIDEEEILQDLSTSLRSEVLQHFCFDSLRLSHALEGLSNGAVISLVNKMTPYVAIPEESVSEIGKECSALYVLQRGIMISTDVTGNSIQMPFGVLIGHIATKAAEEKEGLPTIGLEIGFISASGLKTKHGNPYAVIQCGTNICRSSIKKGKDWKETILMKLPEAFGDNVKINIKGWRKKAVHTILGQATFSVSDSCGNPKNVTINDSNGKRAGMIRMKLSKYKLFENQLLSRHELTVTAKGYCHLYQIKSPDIERMKQSLSKSGDPSLRDRMPRCVEDEGEHSNINQTEKVRHSWRRPSRPCLSLVPGKPSKVPSDLLSKKGECCQSNETETKSGSTIQCVKTPLHEPIQISPRKSIMNRIKSTKIAPIDEYENESERDQTETISKGQIGGNQIIRARALSETIEQSDKSCNANKGIPGRDRDWDNLVDFALINKATSAGSSERRRTSFFVEWTNINARH